MTFDMSMLPESKQFVYLDDLIIQSTEEINFTNSCCQCLNGCNKSNQCQCLIASGNCNNYDPASKFLLTTSNPIFECNSSCLCDEQCINRLVQYGKRISTEVRLIDTTIGYGLFACQSVQANQFLLEYGGCLYSYGRSDRLLNTCSANAYQMYVSIGFAKNSEISLDFVIDAQHYGNEARFINHACGESANLSIFPVWTDSEWPHAAFFSKRSIKAEIKEVLEQLAYLIIMATVMFNNHSSFVI
ncbi:hypothetical protein GJ496_007864 [Pomphorhynchus laevis]|nr:hypothetical protein GJ496_007864 [Pomphorhynchus laevis]